MRNRINFNTKSLGTSILLLSFFLLTSCGDLASFMSDSDNKKIGGVIHPLVGLIAQNNSSFFIKGAYASVCSDPVYAKLFLVNSSGTVDESSPLTSQRLGPDAKYSFSIRELGLEHTDEAVKYLVVAEGCNDHFFKRPVTGFTEDQDINEKTTAVSEVIKVSEDLTHNLREVARKDVELLLSYIEGSSTLEVLDSLTLGAASTKFQEIFGTSPTVIRDARPDVSLNIPQSEVDELATTSLAVQGYHFDPNYSFAYRWKLNGVVSSTSGIFNFTPGANDQGVHTVDLYVGKDDGSGDIDLSKPYFSKTFSVVVSNSALPVAPNFSLDSGTPSPRNTNSVDLNLLTGVSFGNCSSFSSLAITESSEQPDPSLFTLSCEEEGSQKETISFSTSNGSKSLYLWARDSSGVVSSPKTVNFVLDTVPPVASVSVPSSLLRGGISQNISLIISDATSGVATASLYFADDGANYSLVSNSLIGTSSYAFNVPAIDSLNARLKLVVTDQAGFETTYITNEFEIDSTPPVAPSFALFSTEKTSSNLVQITVADCLDSQSVYLSSSSATPSILNPNWVNCSTSAGAHSFSLATDGLHTLYLWGRDAAGNISPLPATQQVFFDTSSPVIASGPSLNSSNYKGESTQTITWGVTDLTDVTIDLSYSLNGTDWTSIVEGLGNIGSHTWNLPALNTNTFRVKIVATDELGFSSEKVSSFATIDSEGPAGITLIANGGGTLTNNKNVLLSIEAEDALSNISAFCLKYNTTITPEEDDICWTSLSSIGETPSPYISLHNYPFELGSLQGEYSIAIWLRDSHGHISNFTQTAEVDSYTINHEPDPAPTIANFLVMGIDNDTAIDPGEDVIIRWSVEDNHPIPAGSISLSYTTDDENYTTFASSLSNNSNGGCTPNAGETGCFVWSAGSPTDQYYRIRLTVSDSSGIEIFDVSNPLNTGQVRFLSGNTSLGIGGAATNAILKGRIEESYIDSHDLQALAVTSTGTIFFNFLHRGIVYISPTDGMVRDLIRQTGISSGDGGSVFDATVRQVTRLTVDYQNNLLIYDYNRIRKVDFSTVPWKITTIAGGGSDSSDGAPALSASLPTIGDEVITVTPNGRIYWGKNGGKELWYYDPEGENVKRYFAVSGLGTHNMSGWAATFDNAICSGPNLVIAFNKNDSSLSKVMKRAFRTSSPACGEANPGQSFFNTSFNPQTGVAEAPHPPQTNYGYFRFTGLNGDIYILDHGRKSLSKYNPLTNTFVRILGTGNPGRCEDGTPALECRAVILSAFVTEYGRIYFVDMGVIRTVDAEGKVRTVAGQPRNFGIGYNPLSARYSQINFFEVTGDDIYVKNELEYLIVQFSLDGGNLRHIAGNTQNAGILLNTDPKTGPIPSCYRGAQSCGFVVDQEKRRLHHYQTNGKTAYLDLDAVGDESKWKNFVNFNQDTSDTRYSILGQNSVGYLAYIQNHYDPHNGGSFGTLRVIDKETGALTHIYGIEERGSGEPGICSGKDGTECGLMSIGQNSVAVSIKSDTENDDWYLTVRNIKEIFRIPSLGGVVIPFAAVSNGIAAYDFHRDITDVDDEGRIYYCSTNGKLYKKDLNSNLEVELTIPLPNMTCAGSSLFYKEDRNSVIFAYKHNALFGIAEYFDP